MQIKDYQQRVLDRLKAYLDALTTHEAIRQQIPVQLRQTVTYDVPRKAWEQVTGRDTYQSYQNALGEDVPHICFKVPTGGGKTYLATRAIELIQHKFHGEQTGLVLWIVPTKSIYRQTLEALNNKHHPYRHSLDKASGGHTLIVEKDMLFTQSDVRENLVVLLLMLQGSNRKNRETELKVFKGRGGFMNFFPDEGNQSEHRALYEKVPNLTFEGGTDQFFLTIKPSLGNVVRLLKPLIILDESHRASSELSHETLSDFNPSFVLELSATPKPDSNILVNVSGQELHQEEMIKLDLHVTTKDSIEWQNTLLAGVEKIRQLTAQADEYRNNGNPYIRPIGVISVERTGKKEDTGQYIHANNARDYLIQIGIHPQAIAIKTADVDELKGVDLLSETCPIQYIITKDALKEGWDCPFAYVLVLLNNTKSVTQLQQLIGRILRQPYAKKTGVLALDESYVFCHQQAPKAVVEAIAKGFRQEGLDDLTAHVIRESDSGRGELVKVPYRQEFADWTIYLPRFVVREGDTIRPISYMMDVLPHIQWDNLSLDDFQINKTSSRSQEHRLTIGLGTSTYNPLLQRDFEEFEIRNDLNPDFFVRQLSDIIPNEWRARRIVNRMIDKLRLSYAPDEIANRAVEISEELRLYLTKKIDGYFVNPQNNEDVIDSIGLAGEAFLERIRDNEIIFFLEKTSDYALPRFITQYEEDKILIRNNNKPIQKSLFEDVPESQLNGLERNIALYLDEQHNLLWWYRHLVGAKYNLQGWRNNRIFTDFVTAYKHESEEYSTVYVLEVKGQHLSGNDDTLYKQEIFKICNREGLKMRWDELGAEFKYNKVEFHMVLEPEWKQKINKLFNG